MTTHKFDTKVVLITGAASGIGRGTAQKLHSFGATLALCDINQDALDGVIKELGADRHRAYTCDVGSSAQVNSTVSAVVEALGQIDYLFNCAGVNPTAKVITETSDEYFDKLMNTNLRGPYNVTRACVPHLQPGAAIVNVASTAGIRASFGYSIYCATKFGVVGFTKAMALELGPKGIRINAVAPGPIDTPTMHGNVVGGDFNEKTRQTVGLRRIGTPEEVADVVAFLFSDASKYMNGSIVEVHGGIQ